MIKTVFILPIAQSDAGRMQFTVQSIRTHCSNYVIAVILDGVNSTEGLPVGEDIEYHPVRYVSQGHWGAIWLNQMTVIRSYVNCSKTDQNTIYVKIDADALVLRSGLYNRALSIFSSRPRVGQLGQVFTDCVGNRLVNKGWNNFYKKTYGIRGLRMFLLGKKTADAPPISVKERFISWLKFRKYIKNSSEPHSYGVGGCYILRSVCVEDIIKTGAVDDKTFLLTPRLGEDVLMGLMISACGYDKMDDTSDGCLFAVGGIYNQYDNVFRSNPIEIAKRGHYVIHPFKFGYKDDIIELNENELVSCLSAVVYNK